MSHVLVELLIHFDGGSRGNPGPAGAGVVIYDNRTQAAIYEAGYFLGTQTNNAAEYMGLLHALERAEQYGKVKLQLRSDSELLVRQLTGAYKVKNPALGQLFGEAQRRLLKFDRWQVQHVRREFNSRADELANIAMDQRETVVVLDSQGNGGALARPAPTGNSGSAAPVPIEPAPIAPGGAPSSHAPPPPKKSLMPEPAQSAPATAPGDDRRVQVTCAAQPLANSCPAGKPFGAERLNIGAELPAGVCVFAAHALLPTVLAIRNTDAAEVAQVPTLTVRCTNPDCRASFRVGPRPATNGHA